MIHWRHTLIAGSAIILLTNAVALGGAGYNRSGEPESRLLLTQRELNRSYSYSGKDNSGLTLSLNWRFEQTELNEYGFGRYSSNWGMPVWLDKAKLEQLGFEVEKLEDPAHDGRRYREFQPREVLLVLELDGAAWQRARRDIREYVDETKKLLAASPANAEMQRKARDAEENHKYEQEKGSRLFVIDAGLDLKALRAAYPDRSRYAILRGLVRPTAMDIKNKTVIGGNITELHAGLVNVPLRFRQELSDSASYHATVAFGQRLEPWIVTASKGVPVQQPEENK